MIYTVYSITRRADGKRYIGYTEQEVEERWRRHKYMAMYGGGCRYISNALKKYGAAAFAFAVLFQSENKKESLAMETHYIRHFNTLAPNGYNLTTGGEHPEWSEESRAKSSATQKVVQNRPEVKAKHKETNARPEVKARKSAANKEAQNRPEVRARNSAAQKAAAKRPEVKAKRAATDAKPEVKARRSAANKEALNRPEVRARNSAAQKAAAKRPEVKVKRDAAYKAACFARNHMQIRQMFIWRRENMKVSMSELGRRLDVSQRTIKRWLQNYQPADVGL